MVDPVKNMLSGRTTLCELTGRTIRPRRCGCCREYKRDNKCVNPYCTQSDVSFVDSDKY